MILVQRCCCHIAPAAPAAPAPQVSARGRDAATDLFINLDPGTYFFGLNASLPAADDPQEFRFDSGSTIGSAIFGRNPSGAFGLGTDWFTADTLAPGFGDGAITITATFPEPTSAGLLAMGLLGLVARRR